MQVVELDEVVARIRAAPEVGAARIVGVDGCAGSGKSTLGRRLATLLDATLVQTDDFTSWDDMAGWWPRLDAEVLTPLIAGSDARYQARDWIGDEFGDSLGPWKTAKWHPIVVVEGVTCTRRESAGRLSYRVWVQAGQPTRLARGLDRDGQEYREIWLNWQRQEDEFFAADSVAGRAELVVVTDSELAHDPATQLIGRFASPTATASSPR